MEKMDSMQELLIMNQNGQLDNLQLLWFRDEKPKEELFDTYSDPHELLGQGFHVFVDYENARCRFQLLQQGLEPDPRAALDAEMLGDRALIGLLWILPDEVEDRLPVKVAGIRARRVTL